MELNSFISTKKTDCHGDEDYCISGGSLVDSCYVMQYLLKHTCLTLTNMYKLIDSLTIIIVIPKK